jgi:putative proteasome-type protease
LTHCLALRLHEGMLFLADTRTNAGVDNVGVDNVGTYRKMHVLQPAEDLIFVIESAGSLATTQQVLDRMARDLAAGEATENLATVRHLFEAALYLGRVSREVANEH